MTDHEKDLVSDLVRTKHGGETVFPLKVVESTASGLTQTSGSVPTSWDEVNGKPYKTLEKEYKACDTK